MDSLCLCAEAYLGVVGVVEGGIAGLLDERELIRRARIVDGRAVELLGHALAVLLLELRELRLGFFLEFCITRVIVCFAIFTSLLGFLLDFVICVLYIFGDNFVCRVMHVYPGAFGFISRR